MQVLSEILAGRTAFCMRQRDRDRKRQHAA
jgi:hypothetical protein